MTGTISPVPLVEAEAVAIPDYMTDPDAVLKDVEAEWRYGKPPDYSKTRSFYANTKRMNHAPGSLPFLVENLVKNWEIEASFKPNISDWRTINRSKYSFSMNGGIAQPGEHMLKVGTYNAIISPNEYYSPENSDFASSHKTFKRMMPSFAWEVLAVYSGPPIVAFRWRHWGEMKNDYVGVNDKGERVTAKAHGGPIDIQGITIATLDEHMKVTHLDTFQDPMDMFRQIAPQGIVKKQSMYGGNSETAMDALDSRTNSGLVSSSNPSHRHGTKEAPGKKPNSRGGYIGSLVSSAISFVRSMGKGNKSGACPKSTIHESRKPEYYRGTRSDGFSNDDGQEGTDRSHAFPATATHPGIIYTHDVLTAKHITENKEGPASGQPIAKAPHSHEIQPMHEEINSISPAGCPFLMNGE